MKRFLSIFLLIFLITTACKKEDKCYELYGTWKVYDVPTDILGNPGLLDFDFVTFLSSDQYSVYHADTIIQGGTFSFSRISPPDIFGDVTINYTLKLKESFNIHPNKNLYNETGLFIIFNGKDSLSLAISVAYSGPNNDWFRFVRK
jgi:hypothetical protein